MDRDRETHEIVRVIVTLAHNLGLTVVAEGIEEPIQMEMLRHLGCEVGQGYLFSRPLPFERLEAWFGLRTSVNTSHTQANLRSAAGHSFPLRAAATRIGRLDDNDIVLADANVSRHHAVIIDTGTSFVITDLRSANGVDVGGQRIRGTATLAHGDRIRICDHQFTFEIAPQQT